LNGAKKELFQTKQLNLLNNGGLRSLYRNGVESSSYVLQFEDMSLHHIGRVEDSEDLSINWSREEALSDITQVEIVSSS
jgi:hypothetical protein